MKTFYTSLVALLALLGLMPMMLHAQTGPIPNGTNQGNFGATLNSNGGHVSFGGGAPPSLNSACGTSPSVVSGTDSAFTFTSGTGSSSTCTITPSVAWKQRPTCSVDAQATTQAAFSILSSGVILLSGVADSTTYNIICIGQPGG